MEFSAIVLAAGAGRRFGGGKLTAEFNGRPLIAAALTAADAAPVSEIIVVVGAERVAVEAVVARCAGTHPRRIVEAIDWGDGMSASLRVGVAALNQEVAGAFVFLADMPMIPLSILGTLAEAVRAGAPAAAPNYQGCRGHPVLLGKTLLERVQSLSGDAGARSLLNQAVLIPTDDPGVLRDVDVPADLTTWLDRPS